MKDVSNEKNKKKVIKRLCVASGVVILGGCCFYLGRLSLIEQLIAMYEKSPNDAYIAQSLINSKFKNLIYEIKVECIGD